MILLRRDTWIQPLGDDVATPRRAVCPSSNESR